RVVDLEAGLLLVSEATMNVWTANDVGGAFAIARHLPLVVRLRHALARVDGRSTFLRTWYLVWEGFRQWYVRPLPPDLDFPGHAVEAFPRDAEILLAAGTRGELVSWAAFDNARRILGDTPREVREALGDARTFLRRSLAVNPAEHEARVRLVHVLIE